MVNMARGNQLPLWCNDGGGNDRIVERNDSLGNFYGHRPQDFRIEMTPIRSPERPALFSGGSTFGGRDLSTL